MKDLVERVKQECADAYFAAEVYKHEPFGVSSEESAFLFQATFPSRNHFPRYLSNINIFLPESLKKLIVNPNEGLYRKITYNSDGTTSMEYYRNQIYVFQYPLNMRRISRHKKKDGSFSQSVDLNYVEDFSQKFAGGSCIYLYFTGSGNDEDNTHVPDEEKDQRRDLNNPLLIGKKEIMQEVMDLLKDSPRDIFDFFYEITVEKERWAARYLEDNAKEVHMYDLLKKPKEVHFKL